MKKTLFAILTITSFCALAAPSICDYGGGQELIVGRIANQAEIQAADPSGQTSRGQFQWLGCYHPKTDSLFTGKMRLYKLSSPSKYVASAKEKTNAGCNPDESVVINAKAKDIREDGCTDFEGDRSREVMYDFIVSYKKIGCMKSNGSISKLKPVQVSARIFKYPGGSGFGCYPELFDKWNAIINSLK